MDLSSLRTLGRSGLAVSPLALGAMTFGNSNFGSPDTTSESIFNAYIDAGGNFIDTADVYSKGRSEELVGAYIKTRSLRDRLILATKYTFNAEPGNPLSGGNSRKNLYRALEGSLSRLQTDYVDLFWMHAWDRITPASEVLHSLADLISAGKIRYFGFSSVPAWYVAQAATLAQAHNTPPPIALQLAYSLVERNIEREHVPAALHLGLGITPWSPLAAGFLSGKYTRPENGAATAPRGRLDLPNSHFQMFTDRNWKILDTLREVSSEMALPMSQIALAWASFQPAVTSPIMGVNTCEQLDDNLRSLAITLTPEHAAKLDHATALEPAYPYSVFSDAINRSIFAGATLKPPQ